MQGERYKYETDTKLIAWYSKSQDKTFKRDGSMAGFGDQAIKFLKKD